MTSHFVEIHRSRPIELVARNFTDVSELSATHHSRDDGLQLSGKSPTAPYAAVEITFRASELPAAHAGLAERSGDHLLASYRPGSGRVTLEQRLADRSRTLAVGSCDGPIDGLAFVLCENQATALVHRSGGWQPLVTARRNVAAFADYRDPRVLRRLQYAYGAEGVGEKSSSRPGGSRLADRLRPLLGRRAHETPPCPAVEVAADASGLGARPETSALTSVRAGSFGHVGLRDPHVVQHADGTPYVRDGRLYLTMTCAGLGFFQQAHWGVFTLDLNDLSSLKQVAQIFFRRDGVVVGDHAGQIIVDGTSYHILTSSWGDFAPGNIRVRYTVTGDDVLSGSHVLGSEPLALPTVTGSWDPGLTRIRDRWYLSYVASPTQHGTFVFFPALAVSPPGGSYVDALELVDADDALHECEGPVLARVSDAVVSTSSTDGSFGSTDGSLGSTDEEPDEERAWSFLAPSDFPSARGWPTLQLSR
jgi:hypothetical protein